MKHPWKITSIIVGWLLIAVVFAMIIAPLAATQLDPVSKMISPWLWLVITISIILLGAVSWYFLMKKAVPATVEVIFAVGLGLVSSRGLMMFFPAAFGPTLNGGLMRLISMTAFAILFLLLFKSMQHSWRWTRRLTPISNLLMIWTTVVAATLIAVNVPWYATLSLLALASIYDAWAVWKAKTMIEMANYFVKRRIIPGIAVPYADKEEFALLGGGDVFFIVLVSVSFFTVSKQFTYAVATGMILSVILLFLVSKKGKFYPALPFILAGALIGFCVGWLL